jgi:hypothetical protein
MAFHMARSESSAIVKRPGRSVSCILKEHRARQGCEVKETPIAPVARSQGVEVIAPTSSSSVSSSRVCMINTAAAGRVFFFFLQPDIITVVAIRAVSSIGG